MSMFQPNPKVFGLVIMISVPYITYKYIHNVSYTTESCNRFNPNGKFYSTYAHLPPCDSYGNPKRRSYILREE
jgi:hypothetical protein